MKLLRTWPLAGLLLAIAGCSGTSTPTAPAQSAAEFIDQGDKALAGGEPEKALTLFSSAVDAQGDSAPARQRRAALYLKLGKFDKAIADCDAALRIDHKLTAAYVTRAAAERGLGENDKALADLTQVLEGGDPEADVLAARGGLYYAMAKAAGKPDDAAQILEKALKDLDRAVEKDPRAKGPRLERAAVCLDLGDYPRAVADCDDLLQTDPHLAEAHVVRARGKFEQGDLAAALADCDAAIGLNKNLIEAYVVRAKARLEKSSPMRTLSEVAECGQAVDDCHTALELAAKFHGDAEATRRLQSLRAQAHESRGIVYNGLRATAKALSEYGQALVLDPYLISALLDRAVAHAIGGDSTAAMTDCETAIHIDSSRAEAYSGRGWIYALGQEYDKAVEDFTQAITLDRKCAKAYLGRAVVRWQMTLLEAAAAGKAADSSTQSARLQKAHQFQQDCIDDSTHAIEANPHLARAYLTRGLALRNAPEKALADFNAAIREDPRTFRAYFNRGVLYFKNNQVDAAIKDFEEAGKLLPSSPEIDHCLWQCWQVKRDPVMTNKYLVQWQEKSQRARSQVEQELEIGDLLGGKTRGRAEPQPDVDVDPLEKAKRDLEKRLDQTASKEGTR